jgi:polyvinyl alcohol dehydrogenase (cytochrome)
LGETTGAILWKTYMTVDNGGTVGGYSGAAVWGSTPMVDTDRGLVYVATGNNYTVPASVAACQLLLPDSPTCTDPANRIDAVVALDLSTGAIRWAYQAQYSDNSTNGCLFGINCQSPRGADNDFAQAPLFVNASIGPIVFVGQKSGIGYALDADTGALKWSTRVGYGIMWGSATDGYRIYVASGNNLDRTAGAWSALDPATGKILWTRNDPGSLKDHALPIGPVSVANGVVYGGSEDTNGPTMFGLDTATGKFLFSYNSGSSVAGGATIFNGVVYWGSGYSRFSTVTGNRKTFAFSLPER